MSLDLFHLHFSAGEGAARDLLQASVALEDLNQRLIRAEQALWNDGLAGAFVPGLQAQLDRFRAAYAQLQAEFEHQGRGLLAVVEMARSLDTSAASQFVTAGSAFAAAAFGVETWPEKDYLDGAWYGDGPSAAKAIVVNGISGTADGARGLASATATEFGHVPVMGVFNTSQGFLPDVFQAIDDKSQALTGVRLLNLYHRHYDMLSLLAGSGGTFPLQVLGRLINPPANPAVQSLINAIQVTGNQATVVAHSQGGAITAAALRVMAGDPQYNLAGLRVMTLGSASFDFPLSDAHGNSITYEHRIHTNDIVPRVFGLGILNETPLSRDGVGAVRAPYDPNYTTWRIAGTSSADPHSIEAYYNSF